MKHLEILTQFHSQICIPEESVVMWKIVENTFILETDEEVMSLDSFRLQGCIYILPLQKTKFKWV